MSKKHEHIEPVVCKHEHLKYCSKCKVVECEECGDEFAARTARTHEWEEMAKKLREHQYQMEKEKQGIPYIPYSDKTNPWLPPYGPVQVTFSTDPVHVTTATGGQHVCH